MTFSPNRKEKHPFVLALTGRIGSGKSAAAAQFSRLGVPVLDLDRVGVEVCQEPGVIVQIQQLFGADVVRDGMLDRGRLRACCFRDQQALCRLEGLLHPPIWERARGWIARQQAPYVVIEASALRQRYSEIDMIVWVEADCDLRRRRVVARGRQSAAQFAEIEALQPEFPQPDVRLDNHGSEAALRRQVARLHARVLARVLGHVPQRECFDMTAPGEHVEPEQRA